MPIYNTNGFWNYVGNEPKIIMDKVIKALSRSDYDFEEKVYKYSTYYQNVSNLVVDNEEFVFLRFPSGLTKYLSEKVDLDIEKPNSIPKKYIKEEILEIAEKVKESNPNFEVRDYQIEAVQTSLNQFTSLIYMGVGTGKTSVMSLICKVLKDDKILILNGNNFILKQIYERLLSFGIDDVSYTPSKEPDYSKRIVILNTAFSNVRVKAKDENYLEFLKNVNNIIFDEAHHAQSLTYFEPIFYTNPDNLKHIIGYSGSPFRNQNRPYTNQQDFVTIALLGEPAFTYEMKDSIEEGAIAQPYSYFINFKNKAAYLPPHLQDTYFMQYRANIIYNKARNKAGFEMLKFLNKYNIKTLASFNTIKPGQAIMKELKEAGVKSLFICGNETIYEWVYNKRGTLKLEKREGNTEDIRKALEGDYNIIFGSQVMDEGVDLDIFQAAVLFSAGKTPIANIQRIGRASRKKKEGLNISFIIDFKDINGYYLFQDHYEKRKSMMEKSGVKNIEKVQDFCKLVEKAAEYNKDE